MIAKNRYRHWAWGILNYGIVSFISVIYSFTLLLKADFHSGKYASDRIGSDRNKIDPRMDFRYQFSVLVLNL
jgi:hypothetical protein